MLTGYLQREGADTDPDRATHPPTGMGIVYPLPCQFCNQIKHVLRLTRRCLHKCIPVFLPKLEDPTSETCEVLHGVYSSLGEGPNPEWMISSPPDAAVLDFFWNTLSPVLGVFYSVTDNIQFMLCPSVV